MKIIGKNANIIWETRKRLADDLPEGNYAPPLGEYIGLYSKSGKLIDSKMNYGLYCGYDEILSFGAWLKMNQHTEEPAVIASKGKYPYYIYGFDEPDLELRREILSSTEVCLTFIFDWREENPDTFHITATEDEVAKAGNQYLEQNKGAVLY